MPPAGAARVYNIKNGVVILKVGLILYSVRDHMAEDPLKTVEAVARMGYKNIEVCNHNAIHDPGCGFGVDAKELKEIFDHYGTKVISAHIFPFEKSDIQAVLNYNSVLGNNNIVNPMGRFSTYDDLMRQCEFFNHMGKICAQAGMTYLYHNHNHEFRTINGKYILDYIIENTDPNYLSLELDTFWVMRAGLNPVEQIKRLGRRIRLVHQKDFAWDSLVPINLNGLDPDALKLKPGEVVGLDGNSDYAARGGMTAQEEKRQKWAATTAFTEIGTGIMPIQDIINAANTYTDAQYIILEQDATRMPTQMDSIEKSMEGFRKFDGISWDA